jgi:hypothetical protein
MMPHKSTEEARRLLARRQAEEERQRRDHQANQQQRKELKRRFAESSESVARRATAKARLDAARLRLALASLLHPRLASHAAIRHEHAPALLDLLFDVATQPPLQFRPVSLSLLTVGHVALVGGGRGGFQLEGVEEPPLPAQMPLAELLRSLAPTQDTPGCVLGGCRPITWLMNTRFWNKAGSRPAPHPPPPGP